MVKYNLKDQQFGKWTVLEYVSRDPSNSQYVNGWRCRCECGRFATIPSQNLRLERTKSCGKCGDRLKYQGSDASLQQLYLEYSFRAKQRSYSFNLTIEQFKALTSKNCNYCDLEPQTRVCTRKGSRTPYIYNGVDRVDNTKGYSIENCVPCCKICNRMKRTLLVDQFLNQAFRIASFSGKP